MKRLSLLIVVATLTMCGCGAARQATSTPVLTTLAIYTVNGEDGGAWIPANPATQTSNVCSQGEMVPYMAVGADQNGQPFNLTAVVWSSKNIDVVNPAFGSGDAAFIDTSDSEMELECLGDGTTTFGASQGTVVSPAVAITVE